MAYVRRYKDLETDLGGLYKDLVQELSSNKELRIVNEMEGKSDGTPFKSVTAVRSSTPRAFVGGLREVTVSLTGEPNDFLLEAHTGAWMSNLALPGAGGFLIGGPIGSAAAAGASGLVAVKFQRDLTKKIKELVKKNSKKELTADKSEELPS
ncbi:MAG: hypothetical protein ABEJ25_08250 [Candidatus Bipolaricaulia bacterium]